MSRLFFILTTFTVVLSAHASNGAGRGGGNGLVCFSDQVPGGVATLIQKIIHDSGAPSDSNLSLTAFAIPDDAIPYISSVKILDLEFSETGADRDQRILILPQNHQPVSYNEWAQGSGANTVENEYNHLASRYDQGIPKIARALHEAQSQLPVAALQIQSSPVIQVSDFEIPGTPKNCLVTTIFNQWPVSDGTCAAWSVGRRLFFHPAHPFVSQVAALFHERSYSIPRRSMFTSESDAAPVYFFVRTTLEKQGTYGEAVQHYNDMLIDSDSEAVNRNELAPYAWFNIFFSTLLKQAGAPRIDFSLAQKLYNSTYRSAFFSTPLLDDATKKKSDSAIQKYLRTKQFPDDASINGWPANFSESALPQP